MMRLIRKMQGHGRRQEEAEEILRCYKAETRPERREIQTRVAAVERLVLQLKKDAEKWH